jgi:NADH dehydrogenase FAD-containing subunit
VLDDVDVQGVAPGALEPAQGPAIPFDLVVWCGGFVPCSLAAESGLAVAPTGGALVDRRMRSVSHPEVLAAGDAAECPRLTNGAGVRMSCQAGMPTGAHAADVLAASIHGREERDFDFGYIAWSISLGRKDGLIQWLDRADRPREHVTRGRRAAWIKELATASGVKSVRWERRLPGAVRWLSTGVDVGDHVRDRRAVREQVEGSG